MNAGTTAERIYDHLKRELAGGVFAPGARLEPARIAHDLASSATPVRDALHRLAGERLVAMRASDGFYIPPMTEIGLRDLYRWNDELLRMALRMRRVPIAPASGAFEPLEAADVFAGIATSSRSPEIVVQVASASTRLAYARGIESSVLADTDLEIRAIAEAFTQGLRSSGDLLRKYHKARLEIVPELINKIFQLNDH